MPPVSPSGPTACFYDSQGLRLHYSDWGNETAPPLVLVHGGRDHSRSWDALARALQPHFHIIAPDLRGHGDSEWPKGSSYSLADYVYDLHCLIRHAHLGEIVLVGHSMGGMVGLIYAGVFPQLVSRLVVLDGVVMVPGRQSPPVHEQFSKWIAQLDAIASRPPRRIRSVAAAAERMRAYNKHLSAEQARMLATHAVRPNPDHTFSWKFDDYQQVRAPYRLSIDDHIALWSRIACPTLLLRGTESTLPDPEKAGVLGYFKQARYVSVAGAGHWLHHDRLDAVIAELRSFLEV